MLRTQDDQQKEFDRTAAELIAGQDRAQQLLAEQVRLMGVRGTLKIYEGAMDADAQIVHYKSVGLTEGWSDDELKRGFHQPKWNGTVIVGMTSR